MGKRTDFRIDCGYRDVTDLISPVTPFNFPSQIHGTSYEKFLCVFKVVFLVVFDRRKAFGSNVVG